MSPYSQGRERIKARIGFPFCRTETVIEEGPEREGRALGVGCWILETLGLMGATWRAAARRAADGTSFAAGSAAMAEKSISGPKSSSIFVGRQVRKK